LEIDRNVERRLGPDADAIERHAESRGRFRRRKAGVLVEVAEDHDAGRALRSVPFAQVVESVAECRHLAFGRELVGELAGIERIVGFRGTSLWRPPSSGRTRRDGRM
jgi:hypothetical protein